MNDTTELTLSGAHAAPVPLLARFARHGLFRRLHQLRGGRLTLSDANGTVTFGDDASDLRVHVSVRDPAFYLAVAGGGSVGAGAAYADGHWQCDDLCALVRLMVRNRALVDQMETGTAALAGWLMRVRHAAQRNTRSGARRNIAAHYDLGNDFFRLFLSPDLMYSAACWRRDADTLEAASARKLDLICRKLGLRPGLRVAEIGCGWGGFAIHAAARYGCEVVAVTISREQYEEAARRVAQAGLQDRVTILLQDYRDLQGSFDRVVSIEMIEAIGAAYLRTYFGAISRLLRPDGMALIQAITIEDQRYAQAVREVDFIKRHIFPGSFIPSIQAMLGASAAVTDLSLVHLEDFGPSYARTLEAWRGRFLDHLPDVFSQGFDPRFARLWEFYLAYCEGGFHERSIGVSQLMLAKPGARMEADRWTRDAMPDATPAKASTAGTRLAAGGVVT